MYLKVHVLKYNLNILMNKFRIDLLNDDRIYNYTLVNLITPAMSEVF